MPHDGVCRCEYLIWIRDVGGRDRPTGDVSALLVGLANYLAAADAGAAEE